MVSTRLQLVPKGCCSQRHPSQRAWSWARPQQFFLCSSLVFLAHVYWMYTHIRSARGLQFCCVLYLAQSPSSHPSVLEGEGKNDFEVPRPRIKGQLCYLLDLLFFEPQASHL
jgi:hypothetical protein